jgi:hypothetical protein
MCVDVTTLCSQQQLPILFGCVGGLDSRQVELLVTAVKWTGQRGQGAEIVFEAVNFALGVAFDILSNAIVAQEVRIVRSRKGVKSTGAQW